MAKKSSKSKTDETKIDIEAAEAVEVSDYVVDEKDMADLAKMDGAEDGDIKGSSADVPDDEDGIAMDEKVDDLEMEIVDEPVAVEDPEPAPAPEPQKSASGGFFPLLLGGIAAGAIGYGIATYYPMNGGGSDDLTAQLSAQADQIAALEAQLADIPTTDLSGVETQISDLGDATTAQLGEVADSLSAQVDALDVRLLEVEKRPGADGTLSDTALAAYQRELEELRAELDAQQETVMSAAAQAEADLAEARAEAERLEREALAAAEAAAARAALNRVATAVETGAPFADALNDLGAADVPPALSAAADTGVATTAQLTDAFPAAARAALATARAEGVSDDAGGIGGFLRSQFDVRSTTPQEGSGPDAVLSRAEAAVKEGRVADALAEIEALPEVARAELTDWTARAQERSDVLDAIADLSETYN